MSDSLQKPKPRSLALDAFRGLAILSMCLSGVVPKDGAPPLASWMFHAQVGPLDNFRYPGALEARAGYTWVDLVLPAFLFAMGCAFPLAIRSKLEKGFSKSKIILSAFARFGILVFFAIYVNNLNPWALEYPPSNLTWIIGFLGFLALFPLIGSLPKSWSEKATLLTRIGGGIACVGFLMYSGYVRTNWGTDALPEAPGFIAAWTTHFWIVFDKVRFYSDIIIMLLANCALVGSIIYLFTIKNILFRMGLMALAFAMWRTTDYDGHWVNLITTNKPFGINLSWFYIFGYLKYLMIVIPGTVIGDLVYEWMQGRKKELEELGTEQTKEALLPKLSLCKSHYIWFCIMCAIIVHLFHIGFHAREMLMISLGSFKVTWIMGTPFLIFAMLWFCWHLIRKGKTDTDILIQKMFQWGVFWLVLGMAFEPLKGGIMKDPSDVTYYFCSVGLSLLLLVPFFIIIDAFGITFGFKLMILNGQNPMIAYMGIRNLLGPIFFLKFFPTAAGFLSIQNIYQKFADQYELSGYARMPFAYIKTYVLAYIVSFATKFKIYWKS